MVDLYKLPEGLWPSNAIRNNGPESLLLERYRLRELAEGWPMYRDACEWENFSAIFDPSAYVYTTWTGKTHHKDFITASQRGMEAGAFIMHRCHGITSDINPTATRAVTKMKATITQRFSLEGCEVDAESDCRFLFFWENRRDQVTGESNWKAKFVRHWYEKDKLIPVDPRHIPLLDDNHLKSFPSGYRYLAYCQEKTMGVTVLKDMPGHIRERAIVGGSQVAADKHDLLYWQANQWLEGEDFEF